jgi:hypothetical protein
MNRRAMVIVPLAALATIVITAAAGGGSSNRLPLPKTVTNGAIVHRAPGGNPGNNPDPGAGSGSSGAGQTYTTTPPVPLTGCAVSVSNPSPFRGQTAETVTVQTAPGAHVALVALYPSHRSTHGGLASTGGSIAFLLPISHAPANNTVRITATATLRGATRSCTTSFTPL